MDLEVQSATPVPAEEEPTTHTSNQVSSQVSLAQMPKQELLRSALKQTESRMEGVSGPQHSLSPLARERWRSDTGLCPSQPHFRLNQILNSKMMDTLCRDHWDEFIYRTTYEIDSHKYEHYQDDLKLLGNKAEELLLQVIVMCTWAYEYYKLTGRMPDPYLLYMLWARSSEYKECAVPTIADVTLFKYWAKCKERWKYLIVLLQFWTDNNALRRIKGSPIWPMLALAKLVKDTANHVLPSGFHISWKHIIERMPWYNFRDYERLLAVVSPRPKECLGQVMLQYHQKVRGMIKTTRRSYAGSARWRPVRPWRWLGARSLQSSEDPHPYKMRASCQYRTTHLMTHQWPSQWLRLRIVYLMVKRTMFVSHPPPKENDVQSTLQALHIGRKSCRPARM